MSAVMIPAIEGTVRSTHTWIRELMEELSWSEPQHAYKALRVVLHALRDRLTLAETVDLGAQLPMLVRGLYYEGWNPGHKTPKVRRKEEFLADIATAFPDDPSVYAEVVAWAVFKILEKHVSPGEIGDVMHVLPADIRALWPRCEAAFSI
jgi:uncharacterized protein (DUF2267 family)